MNRWCNQLADFSGVEICGEGKCPNNLMKRNNLLRVLIIRCEFTDTKGGQYCQNSLQFSAAETMGWVIDINPTCSVPCANCWCENPWFPAVIPRSFLHITRRDQFFTIEFFVQQERLKLSTTVELKMFWKMRMWSPKPYPKTKCPSPVCLSFFCKTQKEILWRKLKTKQH